MKSGFERKFYDLGRVGYWGPQSKKNVDFGFDAARSRDAPDAADARAATWKTIHSGKIERRAAKRAAVARVCGGGTEQPAVSVPESVTAIERPR